MKVSPCPKCGNDRVWLLRGIGDKKQKFHIECPVCHYQTEKRKSPEKAARVWNKETKKHDVTV